MLMDKCDCIVTNVGDAELMYNKYAEAGYDMDSKWITGIAGEKILRIIGMKGKIDYDKFDKF